jgi:hypothetical protein
MAARVRGPNLADLSPTSDGDLLRARGFDISKDPVQILPRNPARIEAWIFNAGGNLELPVDLGAGIRVGAPLPLTAFLDSGSVAAAAYAPSTYKSFVLLVDTPIVWGGAGAQAKVALIVGRQPWAPASGAGSGAGGTQQNFIKGAAANIGGAAATQLAAGIYPFSPVDLPDLQWQWAFIGLEFQWPLALTSGAARLVLAMPGGPPVALGTDEGISPNTGDRANSFLLLPSAPPFRVVARRAIYAATLAGTADLRVWESVQTKDSGPEIGPEP